MDSNYVTKLEKENENLLLKLEAAENNAMVNRMIEIVDNTIDIPDFPNSHKY